MSRIDRLRLIVTVRRPALPALTKGSIGSSARLTVPRPTLASTSSWFPAGGSSGRQMQTGIAEPQQARSRDGCLVIRRAETLRAS